MSECSQIIYSYKHGLASLLLPIHCLALEEFELRHPGLPGGQPISLISLVDPSPWVRNDLLCIGPPSKLLKFPDHIVCYDFCVFGAVTFLFFMHQSWQILFIPIYDTNSWKVAFQPSPFDIISSHRTAGEKMTQELIIPVFDLSFNLIFNQMSTDIEAGLRELIVLQIQAGRRAGTGYPQ